MLIQKMRVYCIKSLNTFSSGHHGCGILASCRSIPALYPNLMSTEGVSPPLSSVNENYMVLIERKREKRLMSNGKDLNASLAPHKLLRVPRVCAG